MTANPLMASRHTSTRDIDEYCAWANSLNWVRASGIPYVVSERMGPENRIERFLGRAA